MSSQPIVVNADDWTGMGPDLSLMKGRVVIETSLRWARGAVVVCGFLTLSCLFGNAAGVPQIQSSLELSMLFIGAIAFAVEWRRSFVELAAAKRLVSSEALVLDDDAISGALIGARILWAD